MEEERVKGTNLFCTQKIENRREGNENRPASVIEMGKEEKQTKRIFNVCCHEHNKQCECMCLCARATEKREKDNDRKNILFSLRSNSIHPPTPRQRCYERCVKTTMRTYTFLTEFDRNLIFYTSLSLCSFYLFLFHSLYLVWQLL